MPIASTARVFAYAVVAGTLMCCFVGCVKFKQVVTVNPDGSGKAELSYGFSQQMLQMSDGEDPFAQFDPTEMIDQEKHGWVAFSEPVIKTEGGYKTASFTGYFEDINKLTFNNSEDDPDMQDTSFTLADGKLTVKQPLMMQIANSIVNNPEMQDPQMKAMMKPFLEGMRFSESYVLPGQVTDAGAYGQQDGSATAAFSSDDVLPDPSDTLKALADQDTLTVSYDAADQWVGGSQDAWSDELAQAKKNWAELKSAAGQ